jgi:hypothetical protein
MSRMMRCIATSVMSLLALSHCARSLGQTTGPAPCVLGYTVGFFNGVWNTEAEAMIGMNALKQSVEEATSSPNDTYNNEDVSYQLFYNQTGNPAGGMSWEDVAEVFQQRQNELDPSGYFSQQHFYAIWEQLTGSNTFTAAMTDSDSHLETFFVNETNAFVVAAWSTLGALSSAPPTSFDYTTQNAELDTIAAAGRKMMLVAHSQGNLFVNQGYDHIQPVVGSTRVKVVHIAPASATLRGQYVLSSNDLVINGLRAVGSVQPNNIAIAPGTVDPTGHTLVNSYLVSDNPGRSNGRAQVEVLESGALSALTAPSGCAVTLSPSSSTVVAGSSVTFTASVNPVPMDNVLNIEYVWDITGNAAGSFPGTSRTATTSVPTILYTVPTGSPSQTIDAISVKVLEAKTAGDQVNAVNLGTGSATVTVQTMDIGPIAPWLGTWKCTSSGGYNGNGGYNGGHTFQFVITATGYSPPLMINTINYDGSGGPAYYFYNRSSAYISGSTLANATFFLSGTLTQNSTYTVTTFNGTTQTTTAYPVVSTCTT